MYGKCGSLDDACMVFDKMSEHNVVSWSSMIAGYTQNHREKDAMKFYVKMQRSGVVPDQFAFGSVIRACAGLNDVELGKQLHGHVLKFEFGAECIIPKNALVAMYTKFNETDSAWIVFDKIVSKDLVSWGSMISGFVQQGCEIEALELFVEMHSLGVYCPNEFIFGSVFSACSGILNSEYGRRIHGLSIKFGFGKDVYAGCSLCDMYAKCGSLESAKKAFYQINEPDLVSWNAIIAGFAYSSDSNESMSLFSQMRHLAFVPEEITIRCLLCSFTTFASLYQGKQVHAYVLKMGLDVDVPVCNTLITMYTNCLDLSAAFNIFDEMTGNLDSVSWNAILTACLRHNQPNDACRFLKLMHSSEYKIDHITLANVLGACAVLASFEMGCQAHNYGIKSGFDADTSVSNGLIDMYTKCGAIMDARKYFESMTHPDIVSWSTLIVGYRQFGYGEEALKLLKHHVGLVEEGCNYYKIMESDYGIRPTREHCCCVVDMLARAGRLKEAENFISQMLFDPDIVVFKTLLAACRNRGDVEVAKRAADSVWKLDPSDSASHVLLGNILASTGNWGEVARVRRLMRSRGVRKVPGQSWIEVKNRVNVFSVEDRKHTNMDKIYSVLEGLYLEMEANCSLEEKVASAKALHK
ncbi:hypothetical protein IFM89_005362 [Coptis chinensis]|uniref:Pentatricopeptide repeat-containing protein n=1 Tax=Coptis chinensis TaxID=261450 RepID=A0A835H9P6_9MAGN|nr:hypothetical protein IFM89_005362 [Coptis chinensis]